MRDDREESGVNILPLILIAVLLYLTMGQQKGCTFQWPTTTVVAPSKVTAAVYVYEKDAGGVPGFMGAALDALNRREPPILATPFEEDTTDSTGETPAQYREALTAAREAGLPSLVVQAGSTVVRVVKGADLKSPEDVFKAVQ